MLRITLLGDFAATEDGKPLDGLNGARLQSFLGYLLVHRSSSLTRRHLAFLLWPDTSESQALTNLRKLVFLARQAIPAADRFIDATRLTLSWRQDAPFTLDLAEFEQALDEVQHASEDASLANAIEQATAVYAGQFLQHLDDEWIVDERDRLHRQLEDALGRAIHWFEGRGELALAIRYAEHRLRQDPLREQSYQDLMRLHLNNGDRAAFLRVYQACVEVLRTQLGARPSPATQRFAAQQLGDVEKGLARLSDVSSAYSHLIGQWSATPSTSTQVISYLVAFATFVADPGGTTGDHRGAAPPSSQPGT